MSLFATAKRVALVHALCALWVGACGGLRAQDAAPSTEAAVSIQFIDSATGYAVRPEVEFRPERGRSAGLQAGFPHGGEGSASFQLEKGRHTLTAASPAHMPVSGEVEVRENFPYKIRILLDPLDPPRELQPADIATRRVEGATLVQGFVVDEDSGEPLHEVRVKSEPANVEVLTDTRGYFQLYIPAPAGDPRFNSPANLVFEKPGYSTVEQQNVELWSGGDWSYTIRLSRGKGRIVNDERHGRRQELRVMEPGETQQIEGTPLEAPPALSATLPGAAPGDEALSTVRVPRNIRVEKDGVIYYVSMDFYTKHVLSHEWIASWNYTSLYAGSVAVRSYAIARINGRSPTSDYDICGTSSCQVFKPTSSSSRTDAAVDLTDGCVLLNANGGVASTEYSAENNSLDRDCGDGFTAPSDGCLYDPICVGRARAGHGRGMCQRGSQRWGAGANGFPARDWTWILKHYYPNLRLFRGIVLAVGDNVRSRSADCHVRACAGGGIDNGISCPLLATKASGQTGEIIGGPVVVMADGKGFTWYQVRWNDASNTTGWSCENYLERLLPIPGAPADLISIPADTNRIVLNWTDTTDFEAGFSVERAPSASGPWMEIARMEPSTVTFTNSNLFAGSTWYYRVRAFNASGNSAFTAVVTASLPSGVAPALPPMHDLSVTPGTVINLTNRASAPERMILLTDFEPFMSETANGVVLFRTPSFSSSTAGFVSGVPYLDLAAVADAYPNPGRPQSMALHVRCSFTNASPWLRLTTANTANVGNPVIALSGKLRFDIYSDRTVRVGVGVRETTTSAGTPIGADGGTVGSSIEWSGVTNVTGTVPAPVRSVTSNQWTTLTFDFATEAARSFSGGNGALSTPSGLAVLEHLAIIPAAGMDVYNLYMDNFVALVPRVFTYSLGPDSPPNATIHPATGVFSWTPTQAQSSSTHQVTVIVTDDSVPPLTATNVFSVTVNDSVPNSSPMLAPIGLQNVYAGQTLLLTNIAYDPNPGDILSFGLDPGAPGAASINPYTGVLTWPTVPADTNGTHAVTVRVTDNGTPAMSATATFSVVVVPPPPPNQAPMLLPISNKTIYAGSTLVFTNPAFDPDGDHLTFGLGAGAPAGASVDPAAGIFSWTPGDSDSNTTRSVSVRVTDDGVPQLTASASFSVTVLPRLPNQPPDVSPISDQVVHAGGTISFTVTASDPDAGDSLSFSLGEDAPAGATIDTLTGDFLWIPVQPDTTNAITVWVTDDDDSPLSGSATFTVVVKPVPVLENLEFTGNAVVIRWSSVPDTKYRVLCKDDLSASIWEPVGDAITAAGDTASTQDPDFATAPGRYYRIEVLDHERSAGLQAGFPESQRSAGLQTGFPHSVRPEAESHPDAP